MRATPWIVAILAIAGLQCGRGKHPGAEAPDTAAQPDAGATEAGCTGEQVQVYTDADRDGHGAGDPVSLCLALGQPIPVGYAATAGDCNDSDPRQWGESSLFVDADGDGIGAGEHVRLCAVEIFTPGYSTVGGDCAPDDPTRWQQLFYSYVDRDGDGFSAPESGTVCAGTFLPLGYFNGSNGPSGDDCDDADPAGWISRTGYLDSDGDGVGAGPRVQLCSGTALPAGYSSTNSDCAPDDAMRWQQLFYAYVDRDGDGFTVQESGTLCAGSDLSLGYTNLASGNDCDDTNLAGWISRTGYLDSDGDGVGAGAPVQLCSGSALPAGHVATGGDCAPEDASRWRQFAYTYRDADGDGYTVAESGTICVGEQPAVGYGNAQNGNDCDDATPALHASVVAYPDSDGDGLGAGSPVTFCTDGSPPAGYVLLGTDCAPEDPASWQLLSYAHVDRDGDGYTAPEVGQVCAGSALPDPFRAAAGGNDCAADDPSLFRWVVLYRDRDGDGIGAGPRTVPCLGASIPAGWSVFGYDPDDDSPAVQVNASEDDELLFGLL